MARGKNTVWLWAGATLGRALAAVGVPAAAAGAAFGVGWAGAGGWLGGGWVVLGGILVPLAGLAYHAALVGGAARYSSPGAPCRRPSGSSSR